MNLKDFERVAICGDMFLEDEKLEEMMVKYKKKNGPFLRHTTWLDKRNSVLFGADESYENTNGYDTCFLTKEDKFLVDLKYGLEKYRNFSREGYRIHDVIKNTEFICERTPFVDSVNGKSVLVIGSGPSAKDFDITKAKEYDQVWVCNDFYKSENLKNLKVDLYYISNECQGLRETIDFVKNNENVNCCFDTTVNRDLQLTIKYKKEFPRRTFLFSTRLFTTIGTSQRLMALAAHLKASKIAFVGVDGKLEKEFEDGECYTSHGNIKKHLPKGQNYSSQNREYVLFWEYMTEKFDHDIEYENLGFKYASNVTKEIFKSPTFKNKINSFARGDEVWANCRKLSRPADSKLISLVEKRSKISKSRCNVWLDHETLEVFGNDLNYKHALTSQESCMLSEKGTFLEDDGFGALSIPEYFYDFFHNSGHTKTTMVKTDEIVYTHYKELDKYKDSSILFLGAGPSIKQVNIDDIEYDFLWTCNQYYKYRPLADKKVDLVNFGHEVDLTSQELKSRLMRDKTNVLFEVQATRNIENLNKFIKQEENEFGFFHSRYYGKVGTATRMLVLAHLLGASKVSFLGVDGTTDPLLYSDPCDEREYNMKSSFEKDKKPTGTTDNNVNRRHWVMFWDYILNELPRETGHTTMYHNLGSCYPGNRSREIVHKNLLQIGKRSI
tara:strand:- start:1845 stop:3845 length:2001 start_codon:yes stop_codon:yes gene_type:complete